MVTEKDRLSHFKGEELNALASHPEKMKEVYYLAYRLYKDARYREATHFFRLLTTADPLNSNYWKGLGAALQMTNSPETALRCYSCAQSLEESQPDPYLTIYVADCHFALKQVDQGLKALELAKKQAKGPGSSKVANHVTFMRRLWSNNH